MRFWISITLILVLSVRPAAASHHARGRQRRAYRTGPRRREPRRVRNQRSHVRSMQQHQAPDGGHASLRTLRCSWPSAHSMRMRASMSSGPQEMLPPLPSGTKLHQLGKPSGIGGRSWGNWPSQAQFAMIEVNSLHCGNLVFERTFHSQFQDFIDDFPSFPAPDWWRARPGRWRRLHAHPRSKP